MIQPEPVIALVPEDWREKIEGIEIAIGPHQLSSGKPDRACLMELVSYVMGRKPGWHPPCASETATEFAVSLNDGNRDPGQREMLLDVIPEIVGSCPIHVYGDGSDQVERVETPEYLAAEEERQQMLVRFANERGVKNSLGRVIESWTAGEMYIADATDVSWEDKIKLLRDLVAVGR